MITKSVRIRRLGTSLQSEEAEAEGFPITRVEMEAREEEAHTLWDIKVAGMQSTHLTVIPVVMG
jgi:hypothetical protein